MKKAVNAIFISVALYSVSLFVYGCSQVKNEFSKFGASNRSSDYTVTLWSGGVAVKQWVLKDTFISTEEGTDGWYFFVDGKIIRVSGNVVVEEQ